MQETWKSLENIIEFGTNYEISNLGRIKSVDRIEISNGIERKRKGTLMKFSVDTHGYLRVELRKNGERKRYKVHRLVGLAFIPNENNLPVINHSDGDKTNNSVENLEWTTYSDNNLHAYKTGLKSIKISDEDKKWIKTVFKPYDKEFGATPLAKKFGVKQSTISNIVRG